MIRPELQQPGHFRVYNRGNNRKKIFFSVDDFQRFIKTATLFQYGESFPNLHRTLAKPELKLPATNRQIHLLDHQLDTHNFSLTLFQSEPQKISKYMQRLMTSYTKYFNERYNHEGALFKGAYKLEVLDI